MILKEMFKETMAIGVGENETGADSLMVFLSSDLQSSCTVHFPVVFMETAFWNTVGQVIRKQILLGEM